ncbi:MAG: LacI family DNA-binding transcriptional regulator [Anaerolineales bacterium]
MHQKKPTIADIANQAGVSKTTVSRVINDKPDVSPETREKVLKIVEETRFVPNLVAKGLSSGGVNLLSMLLPSLAWPWVLEVIRGIAERVEQSSYELVLFTTSSKERSEELFNNTFASGFTDGLIAIVPPGALSQLSEMYTHGFPVVLVDDRGHHPEFPSVVVANYSGAYKATSHLLEQNHTSIAFISGPMEYGCNQERQRGYLAALSDAAVSIRDELIREGDFTEAGGYAEAQALLELSGPPTAIFAANDLMALGVMEAVENRGLSIPMDIAVVGFDDIPQASIIRPSLTTVQQPMYKMGQTAVEMILSQIEGVPLPEINVKFETELIVRKSSNASL